MGNVDGVGKDAPTVVNENGGKQSKVLYRFDLLAPEAMFEMTKVLKEGADKYGDDNWRSIPVRDHLNHLIIHAYAYLAGDTSDDHLSHIMCRAMFAQAVDIEDRRNSENKRSIPDEHKTESNSDDDFIHCGSCSLPTIPRKEGVHECGNCGQGQSITLNKTGSVVEYISNPVPESLFAFNGWGTKAIEVCDVMDSYDISTVTKFMSGDCLFALTHKKHPEVVIQVNARTPLEAWKKVVDILNE